MEFTDPLLFFSGINIMPGEYVTTGKHQINLTPEGFTVVDEEKKISGLTYQVLRPKLPVTRSICEPLYPALRTVMLGEAELEIQPGLTLIIGQSTVGKTTLLNELFEANEVLIWNEPREEALFSTVEVALALASKLATHDIIGIDSFSSILYEGPTKIEKGLSAEMLNALVRIDSFCKRKKKAIVATFAPMILDSATLQTVARSIVNQKISTGIYLPEVGVMEISQRAAANRAWRTVKWSPVKGRPDASTLVQNYDDYNDDLGSTSNTDPIGKSSTIADGGHLMVASRTHSRYQSIMASLAADAANSAQLTDKAQS